MPRPWLSALVTLLPWVILLGSGSGCEGDAAQATPERPPVLVATPDDESAIARAMDELAAEPTPARLLAALAPGHEYARARLGAHHLRYRARFTTTPEEVPELPEVDHASTRSREVDDVLDVVWGGDGPTRLHLFQGSAEGIGRDLLVDGEQVYTRLPHREWQVRTVEGGGAAHWQWLDDAQHSLHDVVAFAAPQLALSIASGAGDNGLITLTAQRSDAVDPSLFATGLRRDWRKDATIDNVEGTIAIDRASGLWRSGSLSVAYHLTDVEGRRVDGSIEWSGTLTRVIPPPDGSEEDARLLAEAFTPPTAAEPVPTRLRYETEKRELLNGL